jgi:hypothetical protein
MPTVDALLNAKFWDVVPTLLWAGVVLFVARRYRRELAEVLADLKWRIKSGASVKFAAIEFGQSYVSPSGDIPKSGGAVTIRPDKGDSRFSQRKQYYEPNRNLQLVHRIAPSMTAGQLYDILVYLIPHGDATLAAVQRVEYYFGRHWANGGIFVSADRARGFSVSTSAWGPFMCTAEIRFTDGETALIARYVDFEMGASGGGRAA